MSPDSVCDDEGHALGVVEEVVELEWLDERVERRDPRADVHHTERGGYPLDDVGRKQTHGVAATDTSRAESLADLEHRPFELGVSHARAIGADKCFGVGGRGAELPDEVRESASSRTLSHSVGVSTGSNQ